MNRPAGRLPFATRTQELHHEVELVLALGEGGREIAVEQALDHVFGYGVGLGMTRRDMRAVAKKAGRPGDMARGLDQSAPTGPIHAFEELGHPTRGPSGFASTASCVRRATSSSRSGRSRRRSAT